MIALHRIMKGRIVWAILFLHISFAKAQELSPGKAENIRAYILNKCKISAQTNDTSCANTVIFIRFKVTDAGNIDSLYFTKGGPAIFKQQLKTAIMSTNGLWKLTKQEKAQLKDRTFLLPVILSYSVGCTVAKKDSITVGKDGAIHIVRRNADVNLKMAMEHMLNFESGGKAKLNCVLLAPIAFTNNMY
ncbi:hypothetical protein BDD43_1705 [Mucilaginibacter gracilis]|uniref:Uncharacterized protein n=2 Tax=Mucilaginibacter gracilis TaxID=423350 RepID=A0A495IZM8_9SPHI|nr:hypothetical protein BDD43_1705 [Mucilaginibacter gracilis]